MAGVLIDEKEFHVLISLKNRGRILLIQNLKVCSLKKGTIFRKVAN